MHDCRKVQEALVETQPFTADLEQHLVRCSSCRSLHAFDHSVMSSLGVAPEPLEMSPALQECLRTTRPVRPYSLLNRMLPAVLLAAVLALLGYVVFRRRDFSEQWSLSFAFGGLLWCGLVCVSLTLVFRRRSGLAASATTQIAWAVSAFALGECVASLISHPVRTSLDWSGPVPWSWHFRCLGLGTVVSVIVLAIILRLARRSVPNTPRATGIVAGVAAASTVVLMQHIECPIASPLHVAVGHLGSVVIAGVVGALIAERTLAP